MAWSFDIGCYAGDGCSVTTLVLRIVPISVQILVDQSNWGVTIGLLSSLTVNGVTLSPNDVLQLTGTSSSTGVLVQATSSSGQQLVSVNHCTSSSDCVASNHVCKLVGTKHSCVSLSHVIPGEWFQDPLHVTPC